MAPEWDSRLRALADAVGSGEDVATRLELRGPWLVTVKPGPMLGMTTCDSCLLCEDAELALAVDGATARAQSTVAPMEAKDARQARLAVAILTLRHEVFRLGVVADNGVRRLFRVQLEPFAHGDPDPFPTQELDDLCVVRQIRTGRVPP